MRRSFKNAAAGTMASLALLLSGVSEAETPPSKQQFVDVQVSYNFPPNKRTVHLDCKSLVIGKRSDGTLGLAPTVSYAAQFDLLPRQDILNHYNSMSAEEKKALLSRMAPEEQHTLTTLA